MSTRNAFEHARALSLDEVEETLRPHHRLNCAFCGGTAFQVLPDPKDDAKPAEFSLPLRGEKVMPCFGVGCVNCGNTLFLSISTIGKLHKTRMEGENHV